MVVSNPLARGTTLSMLGGQSSYRVVNEARSAFVVLDTAPTGHSLLLMDATGAYHRQMTQQYEGSANAKHLITPLMRLQDADMTHVIIVTLPEVTPVRQSRQAASSLQATVCSQQPPSASAWPRQ